MGNVNESSELARAEIEGNSTLNEPLTRQPTEKLPVDLGSGSAGIKDDRLSAVISCVGNPISMSENSHRSKDSFANTSLPLSDSVIPEAFDLLDSQTTPQVSSAAQDGNLKTNSQKNTHLGWNMSVLETSMSQLSAGETKMSSDKTSAPPHEGISALIPLHIPVVTYADATNVATLYPELASTVLSMPLPHAATVVLSSTSAQDDMDRPRSSMPEHTEDQPNWALAPDPPCSESVGRSLQRSKLTTNPEDGVTSSRAARAGRSSKSRDSHRIANVNQNLNRDKSVPTIAPLPPSVQSNPPVTSKAEHNLAMRTAIGVSSFAPRAHEAVPSQFGLPQSGNVRHEGFASANQPVLDIPSSFPASEPYSRLNRSLSGQGHSFDTVSQEAYGECKSTLPTGSSESVYRFSLSASPYPSNGAGTSDSRHRLDANPSLSAPDCDVTIPSPLKGSRTDEGHDSSDYSLLSRGEQYRADACSSYHREQAGSIHAFPQNTTCSDDGVEQRYLSQFERERQERLERSGQNRSKDGRYDSGSGGRQDGWLHHGEGRSDSGRPSISSGARRRPSYDERACDGCNGSTYGIGYNPQKHHDPHSDDRTHHGSSANTERSTVSMNDYWKNVHDAWAGSASENRSRRFSEHQAAHLSQNSYSNGQQQDSSNYGTSGNDGSMRSVRSMITNSRDQTLYPRRLAPDPQEQWIPLSSYEDLRLRGGSQPVVIQGKSVCESQGNENEWETQLSSRNNVQQGKVAGHYDSKASDIKGFASAAKTGCSLISTHSMLPLNRNVEAGFHDNPPPPQSLADIDRDTPLHSNSSGSERSGVRHGTCQELLVPVTVIPRPSLDAHDQLEEEFYPQRKPSRAGLIYATSGHLVPLSSSEQRCSLESGGRLALDTCGTTTRVITPPVKVGAEAMVSDAVKIPSRGFEATQVSTEPFLHRQGCSVIRKNPEEVLSWRTKRAESTDWKLGWRAQSSSPKYVPPARSGSASTTPYQSVAEVKKYGLISSGTPIPLCADGQNLSPLRDVRQRINTPPLPSVNRFDSELLDKSTILDAVAVENCFISASPKILEYRERGKENITNVVGVRDIPQLQ